MSPNTTPFLLNINPFHVEEPPISNDEFLRSLDAIGVWLRVLAANESLERFRSSDQSDAERMAALANIYIHYGAQAEDQAVALIAFSVWSKDRSLLLPDLFNRIFLRRSTGPLLSDEVSRVLESLSGGGSKSVHVDQRAFFAEVGRLDDSAIVELFLGYPWKKEPSVRLIPKRHRVVWTNLPGELRRIAGTYYDIRQAPRLATAFNKLKHGPQLVIQNPFERARSYGKSSDAVEQLKQWDRTNRPSIRLLFEGSKTQGDVADEFIGSVAPFLIDDEEAINILFYQTMVHNANFFSILVKMEIALARREPADFGNSDAGILKILQRQREFAGRLL